MVIVFNQIIIQVILILAFVLFGIVLLKAGGSARTQAIRTIVLIVLMAAAIVAVLFPGAINVLAQSVGVGRGTDLLLYAFIVVFIGNALTTTRRLRSQNAQTTLLARKIALSEPLPPFPDDASGAVAPKENA